LSVQALDCGGSWEAGCESSSTELSGSTTWCKHTSDCDIFDEGGINLGALDQGLEGTVEEVRASCVLEATFTTLGEGGAEGAGYDDLRASLGIVLPPGRVMIKLTSSAFLERMSCLPMISSALLSV
jgi:hypothetical protein